MKSRFLAVFLALRSARWMPPLVLLAWVLLVFGGVIFSSSDQVISYRYADLPQLFLHWRYFGFSELKHGHLALWNPYILCGAPFLGDFQSALLYPFNALYLVLPMRWALNLDIAGHVYLVGLLQFGWLRWRGGSTPAALLGAMLLMGCAPFFLHVFPGHLTPLAVMAWAPLVLWSCEALLKNPSRRAALAGSFALAMQILAGYPQYMAYTAAGVFFFALAFGILPSDRKERVLWRGWIRIALLYFSSALLAAAQLGAGLEVARESVRSSVTRNFAASFSLTPESVITLFAPRFFGDVSHQEFWGRFDFWEMTIYFGIAGLALAVFALCRLRAADRARWMLILGLLFLLALGVNTPLFDLLYRVPGFGSFRAPAKFTFPLIVFVTLLAATGFDALRREVSVAAKPGDAMRGGKTLPVLAIGFFVIASTLLGGAFYLRAQASAGLSGWWGKVFDFIVATDQSLLEPRFYAKSESVAKAASFATDQLFIAAAICALVGALCWMCRTRHAPVAARLLGVLATLEILVFARCNYPSFTLDEILQAPLVRFIATAKNQDRFVVQGMSYDNISMTMRAESMAGYDPALPRRYSEFIEWSQGYNPDLSQSYLLFRKYVPLYRMLRCRYVYVKENRIADLGPTLPHALLLDEYSVVSGANRSQIRNRVFAALSDKKFDPSQRVILESAPFPESNPATPRAAQSRGVARILNSSTDSLEIEADAPRPMILLVTDSYSSGWRARGLPDSSQQEYSVLPANWVLRAIPLQPGHHHLVLEYAPRGWVYGRWVSLAAWACWLVFAVFGWRRKREKSVVAFAGDASDKISAS